MLLFQVFIQRYVTCAFQTHLRMSHNTLGQTKFIQFRLKMVQKKYTNCGHFNGENDENPFDLKGDTEIGIGANGPNLIVVGKSQKKGRVPKCTRFLMVYRNLFPLKRQYVSGQCMLHSQSLSHINVCIHNRSFTWKPNTLPCPTWFRFVISYRFPAIREAGAIVSPKIHSH